MKRIEYTKIGKTCLEVARQCEDLPTAGVDSTSWSTWLYEKAIISFEKDAWTDVIWFPAVIKGVGKGTIEIGRDGHYYIYIDTEEECEKDDC